MKKKEILMAILLIIVCGSIVFVIQKTNAKASKDIQSQIASSNGKIDVEITDNYFIQATNDIYLNLGDYIGKTVKIEGLVYSYEDTDGSLLYAVVRNTPGCCGSDGLAGLDIRYEKDYPAEDTWVEVIGVIQSEKIWGEDTPVIYVQSITEKEKGTSFVTN